MVVLLLVMTLMLLRFEICCSSSTIQFWHIYHFVLTGSIMPGWVVVSWARH
jgi:hypothetical protein